MTVAPQGGRLVIDGVNQAAADRGILPGQALADARAADPDLAAVEADPIADRRVLADLADWCGRYTPWTSVDTSSEGRGQGGLWLDISGVEGLFGGAQALAEDVIRRLAVFGWRARVAVAATPGAAWALARFDARAGLGLVAAPGDTMSLLAPLSIRALRLTDAVAGDLERFGLSRIGDLPALPRAALAQRFGADLGRRLDQALGRQREPISPRRPVAPCRAQANLAEPIATLEQAKRVLADLLDRLCADLAKRERGARRLELAIHRLDGAVRRVAIGTHRGVREPAVLLRLLAEHLDKLDIPAGLEVMAVAAVETEAMGVEQLVFLPAAETATTAMPAALIDRLTNRLGAGAVMRLATRPSHVPERAQAWLPLDAPNVPSVPAPAARAPRPARLLNRPEPLDAVLAPMPDAPPRRFSWRGAQHRVTRAEGPERVATEWWRGNAGGDPLAARDYYRVEDESGRRYWVFRDGPYQPGAGAPTATPTDAPRWYLHGVFA